MDMIWIVLYGSFGDFDQSKEIAGIAFYRIYGIHLKEGPRKFKTNFMKISAPFEYPVNFYLFYRLGDETCFRSGEL